MRRGFAARFVSQVSQCAWGLTLCMIASQAHAFEAFDGRLQAHGFYEMQLRAINADYSEDWNVTQWYHVFNLELEFDLIQDPVGVLDLLSAYVRAEVRYDCIYSRGCGMVRSINTYGDRSKSLPRRLSDAESQENSGEIPIRNEGRVSGGTTDPVPLSEVAGFSGVADTDGNFIVGTRVGCDTNPATTAGNRSGVDCFPNGLNGIRPFDYIFERFVDFRFSMVNVIGGSGSGTPIQILGPWLPRNRVETTGTMADRVNPFDNSRLNPVLNCRFPLGDCLSARLPGNGGRPFRPIPVFAEDRSNDRGAPKIQVVVYKSATENDPNNPDHFRVLSVDPQRNHGDARFQANGVRSLLLTIADPLFAGDVPGATAPRLAYDARDLDVRRARGSGGPNLILAVPISSDFSSLPFISVDQSGVVPGRSAAARTEFVGGKLVTTSASTQARGLFVPSPPLRRILREGKVDTNWPLNLTENERAWNRGLSQKDEKELKEAYLDIELFDSRLWLRLGKQQIVWGKTELFRTTDQFNPQDLALATLPSLEESRIALWSARGVFSFYEVGPLQDVRLEVAVNIDDYQSSDFGSCGEPYVVNVVCSAQFGAFAHGFTGVGIIGVEPVPDPWQSSKGWEIGGRLEWRWDRFSFALSDFWGYADLPSVRRVTTYERNVDPQTGRPLIYQGFADPALRRQNLSASYAQDTRGTTGGLWNGIGQGDDPWQDPFGDLRAVAAAQAAAAGGVNGGTVPLARDPATFVARGSRVNCGATITGGSGIRFNPPGSVGVGGTIDPGTNCLTEGPSRLRTEPVFNGNPIPANFLGTRQPNRDLGLLDPNDPRCQVIDTDGDGRTDSLDPACPYQPTNALDAHHANLSFFTWLCAATVGFLDLDRTSCAQTVFGSSAEVGFIKVAEAIGRIIGGDPTLNGALTIARDPTCGPLNSVDCHISSTKGSAALPYSLPTVTLSNDPGDVESLGCVDFATRDLFAVNQIDCSGETDPAINFLAATLSPEQEALLGCGPFWGTNCDKSGVDLLNMEPSAVLQSFAGASGTLESIRLKQQGIRPAGSFALDPTTGLPEAFRQVDEYRTDEGLQPGTLPWEVSGIGGPLCSTADIGGEFYPRGGDRVQVPTSSGTSARPATRKQALPGCHRKWVDRVNGYVNPAWGASRYQTDPATGNLITDPTTGLPLPLRDASGNVIIDYAYYSGDPDPLGVVRLPTLAYPDSVVTQNSWGLGGFRDIVLNNAARPDFGAGHPFASRNGVLPSASGPGRPRLTVPFASEMAGLSWNFQMLAVSFSPEFADALETIGDLVDPVPTNPAVDCGFLGNNVPVDLCGANVEGGSQALPVFGAPNPSHPSTIRANRRVTAQQLFGYCGSEYGVINPATGLGTCRIDGRTNSLPALQGLYQFDPVALALNGGNPIDPNDLVMTQRYQDTLQFIDIPMIERVDAELNPGEREINLPATGRFNVLRSQHCSFITPQHCSTVRALYFLAGVKRNTLEAGGNGNYGRRTNLWHSGGEITLYVPKRNVLGFAMDFAEDRTKSNFSIETTWIENVPTGNSDAFFGSTNTDEFNLTVSVDRPTFVNFINPNRTLFINSQWFFQYRRGVKKGFQGNGPFNALATLTVFTGYFQDRLNPSVTFVHDIQSASGGLLPSINYRFNENFTGTIGAAWFYGRQQRGDIANNEIGPASNQAGDDAYLTGVQNGISIARSRDEIFLRLRYTF